MGESRFTVSMNGHEYMVDLASPDAKVWVIIHRSPVSPRGFYQDTEVYRTIKPGSQNYRRAVRLAVAAQVSA